MPEFPFWNPLQPREYPSGFIVSNATKGIRHIFSSVRHRTEMASGLLDESKPDDAQMAYDGRDWESTAALGGEIGPGVTIESGIKIHADD